jgi:hypothetical protein
MLTTSELILNADGSVYHLNLLPEDLADDITKSRIYLGLHYQTDCDFGYYMADLVLNHPDFKKKYKL